MAVKRPISCQKRRRLSFMCAQRIGSIRGGIADGIRGRLGYLFMRPAVGRIRALFDYEKMGASPLLGVKGMVLITHGSAKRRMIEFAVEAGAVAARARIPDLIADAIAASPRQAGPAL